MGLSPTPANLADNHSITCKKAHFLPLKLKRIFPFASGSRQRVANMAEQSAVAADTAAPRAEAPTAANELIPADEENVCDKMSHFIGPWNESLADPYL